MIEDFTEFEVGDLLRATGPVFAVDPDLDPTDTLHEGTSTVYPKGTIALVIKLASLPEDESNISMIVEMPGRTGRAKIPVGFLLIGGKIAVVLLNNFEVFRKNGAFSSA